MLVPSPTSLKVISRNLPISYNKWGISFAFAKVIAEYILKIVPQGTHQYEKFIKPSELARLVELADFKIEDVSGVKLNPTDYTFTLSSMTKINYFMTSTKKWIKK